MDVKAAAFSPGKAGGMTTKAPVFVPGSSASGKKSRSHAQSTSTHTSTSSLALFSPEHVIGLDFFVYLPLDELSIPVDDGITDQSVATHDRADIAKMVNRDLKTLLTMDFVHFWSQILYDNSLFQFLDTYLWYAKSEQKAGVLSEDHMHLLSEVRRRVFLVVVRMGEHKESSTAFLTPEEHGKIIYDNWSPPLVFLFIFFAYPLH
jgi:hypothetical protein